MSDPICDITEVTLAGDVEAFSTIGEIAEVTAACDVSMRSIYRMAVETTAAGAVATWDRYATWVNVQAQGAVTTLDHLAARSMVTVTARGTARALQVLRDLAAVSAAGAVTITQSSPRDVAVVAAHAAVTAIQGGVRKSFVTVRAKGAVTITNATSVRQIVEVAAAAAVAVIQHHRARNLVTVSAHAAAELLADFARRREIVTVTAAGGVVALQSLTAHNTVEVEACADAEIVDAAAGGPAWTAATETLGMSRHLYPVALRGLAPLGDALLAIGPAGAYLLDGADDGPGAPPITATMTGPLVDTGDSALKHPVALYIAYTSTKPVAVAVGETSTGVERTFNYTSPAFSQSAPRPIRVPTGKGLRSRYLRFAISNTEGAPMTVFAAEHDYIQTGRRT